MPNCKNFPGCQELLQRKHRLFHHLQKCPGDEEGRLYKDGSPARCPPTAVRTHPPALPPPACATATPGHMSQSMAAKAPKPPKGRPHKVHDRVASCTGPPPPSAARRMPPLRPLATP
mmetsp:Transcript_15907/g.32938  ORF Transcript_15907/g.32938 Transcript_15907/m.32938 type:complete len:117 (-) Transcript_15907:1-351(-)